MGLGLGLLPPTLPSDQVTQPVRVRVRVRVTEQVVAIEVHVAHRGARLVEEHPAREEDAVLTEQRPRRTHPWS